MLKELDALPDGLLELPASRLHERLSGPTLIHLQGRHTQPLFVSVLLHGNEDSGWSAVQQLLRDYQGRELPRSLSILIGNVSAARDGVRRLAGQPDFNRVWNRGDTPEHRAMAEVLASMERRQVFASIDVHNNTGLNPHYGCINVLDHRFLYLATLFGRTIVYFLLPDSVQSLAFSRLCPAVTVECGKVGQALGIEHARQFIEAVLHLDHFPEHKVAPTDYELFHTVATVKVLEGVDFTFNETSNSLQFTTSLDALNFRELPKGTFWGHVNTSAKVIEARGERGEELTDRYFEIVNGQLRNCLPVMPSMLTLNSEVIRQDCLCYLMERLPPVD